MSEPVDLDALEALEKAATTGPWYQALYYDGARSVCMMRAVSTTHSVVGADGCNPWERPNENALFIAALRNAAPALFAELRAARARIVELEAYTAVQRSACEEAGKRIAELEADKARLDAYEQHGTYAEITGSGAADDRWHVVRFNDAVVKAEGATFRAACDEYLKGTKA